jgi:glutamate--cysteine ligase
MDFQTEGYEDLELSTQILIKEALRRNISVEILDRGESFIRLKKGDRVELVKQATRTARDSYLAPLVMENKAVTKRVLAESGILVPVGRQYAAPETACADYPYFAGKAVVVKPNATNFGIAVAVLAAGFSFEDYAAAVREAFTHDGSVLVEEFVAGPEYRFLIIADEVAGILRRVPANVSGDGVRTVTELVAAKNLDPRRGHGYTTPLEKISLGQTEIDFLAGQGNTVSHVPAKNEMVFLRNNSNISTGGDSLDFTDAAHSDYALIARRAARAVGAKICGADIIIPDIAAPARGDAYAVIELNFNPALHIHAFPFRGVNRHPEKRVLDLLGFGEEVHV